VLITMDVWMFCGQAHHHASISSYNMLHYLNEYLGPKNPQAPRTKPDDGGELLCHWDQEMQCVQDAINVDPEQLERDIEELQKGLRAAEAEVISRQLASQLGSQRGRQVCDRCAMAGWV
jgi:hypothetical protein